jgi:hypothetical protein
MTLMMIQEVLSKRKFGLLGSPDETTDPIMPNISWDFSIMYWSHPVKFHEDRISLTLFDVNDDGPRGFVKEDIWLIGLP